MPSHQTGTNVFAADTYLENLAELGLKESEAAIATSICARTASGQRLPTPLSEIQVLGWPSGEDGAVEKASIAYVWSDAHEVLFLVAAFAPGEPIDNLSATEMAEVQKLLLKLIWWALNAISGSLS